MCHPLLYSTLDGWTTADVEYKWKQPDPVQFAGNLFLPGGFDLSRWVISRLYSILGGGGPYMKSTTVMIFFVPYPFVTLNLQANLG